MNQQQNIEQQLWSYIDGLSSAEERSAIQKMIETNLEWKNKYHELIEMHQLLNAVELEQPSMRFTKNVMEEIAKLILRRPPKIISTKRSFGALQDFSSHLLALF